MRGPNQNPQKTRKNKIKNKKSKKKWP